MARESHARERLLLASLLLFVAGLCLQPITESDLFFRLRVGQEIWTTGRLPRVNLFSFTAPDFPDLDLSWAFEVAVALIHRAGGFPGIVLGKTMWIAATFAGAFALCRQRGAGPLASALVLAVAALVMRERLVERPHIVSFAGELTVLWALDRLRRRKGSQTADGEIPTELLEDRPWARAPWRNPLLFFMAMVAWGNMHAGIFGGVWLALLTALGSSVVDRRLAGRAVLLAGAIGLAATINPAGLGGLIRYLELHVSLPRLHAIDEFRVATLRSDGPFFVWLFVAAALVAAASRWTDRLRHPARLLPVLGLSALGLASVRFSADAVLVSAPIVATALSVLGQRVISLLTLAKDGAILGRLALFTSSGALVLAAVAPRLAAAHAGQPFIDLQVDRAELPLDGLRFVTDNGLRERMYNDFEVGSYLLFEGYPRYRVFVDPRLPAYPEQMHRLLGAFDLDRATWTAAMTSYGVETALLAYAGVNRRVAWWDPAEWALVYRAHDTRVFVRRRVKWRDLIATYEVPATFDFTVEEGTRTRLLVSKPIESPVSDCEWQRRLGDLAFELEAGSTNPARAYFEHALSIPGCLSPNREADLSAWLGGLEVSTPDDSGHALRHLNRALELRPTDSATRANRARLFERLALWSAAASDWALVAASQPDTAIGIAAATRARKIATRGGSTTND